MRVKQVKSANSTLHKWWTMYELQCLIFAHENCFPIFAIWAKNFPFFLTNFYKYSFFFSNLSTEIYQFYVEGRIYWISVRWMNAGHAAPIKLNMTCYFGACTWIRLARLCFHAFSLLLTRFTSIKLLLNCNFFTNWILLGDYYISSVSLMVSQFVSSMAWTGIDVLNIFLLL